MKKVLGVVILSFAVAFPVHTEEPPLQDQLRQTIRKVVGHITRLLHTFDDIITQPKP
jgi:hypothetical protein